MSKSRPTEPPNSGLNRDAVLAHARRVSEDILVDALADVIEFEYVTYRKKHPTVGFEDAFCEASKRASAAVKAGLVRGAFEGRNWKKVGT